MVENSMIDVCFGEFGCACLSFRVWSLGFDMACQLEPHCTSTFEAQHAQQNSPPKLKHQKLFESLFSLTRWTGGRLPSPWPERCAMSLK